MQWPPPPLPRALIVDGVEYRVPEWMEVGHSFFIPCLNHKRMYQAVLRHYTIRKWEFAQESTTDKNIWGIRVWRVV